MATKKGFPQPRKWVPKFPEKYKGNHNQIISRSSWERKFFRWADENPSIISWSSEEIVIPYRCGTDNEVHRYFVDAMLVIKTKSGSIDTYLVEIKPKSQTIPPVAKGVKTKRFIEETLVYVKNVSKWKAAEEYARQRGQKFVILTEDHLGIK